jgi:hypothetical protein
MADLKSNLVKRVDRLPKPRNAAMALQPLFEAISNGIQSTQERYKQSTPTAGNVTVTVVVSRDKRGVTAEVADNGKGLNKKNWEAFQTTDTDNKITIGGKGVGRLLWLDCFREISVESRFSERGKGYRHRKFKFVLSNKDQFAELSETAVSALTGSTFIVRFRGLRDNGYKQNFPGRGAFIFTHFVSHFLPIMVSGRCPKIVLKVNDETKTYPKDMAEIVRRRSEEIIIKTKEFGTLQFKMLECEKSASSDLKGSNFIHFVGHDRTVVSQSIDGKLGLKAYGPNKDSVFHGILTGDFLDGNVNQERTAFNFPDSTIDKIVSDHCFSLVEEFLSEPLLKHRSRQREILKVVTDSYPSVAFGDMEELQGRVPSGELEADAIYGHLARERFRRDERQAEKIRAVLTRLKGQAVDPESFFKTLAEAGQMIEDVEQRSLADYVVRRKVVLEFLNLLIEKVRNTSRDSSYQREDVLHSLICPMRIGTVNGIVEPAASHELWIVDERLTFAKYFSSDLEFDKIADRLGDKDRADLVIFDHVHGLRSGPDEGRVLLVEFKRPGREDYDDDENPQMQVERYIRKLQSGKLKDNKGRKIELADGIFHCFVIADIVGKLDDWTYSWPRTPDGRGRLYQPRQGFKGSIEIIPWDCLLADAHLRNEAFFERAGISGKSFFLPDGIG